MKKTATAMLEIIESEFWPKAQAYCYERGINDFETARKVEAALRHKAFMREIEPLAKRKATIMNFAMPPIIFHSDGRIERLGDGLSEAERKALTAFDELIEGIAKKYGFEIPAT